ncbi:DNA phosphorothioation-dependent restriction protein DptF [Oceanobacillus halophilus]|uniref:DNA phosphorothioation-dependent restriction protein DptF n=1 Tax=Oceanobacillus halophilus TaxID=930130 RepID=A0A494ZUJ5_9BACI|nr:DNA phosphorothioation-dependent restriction protein DptF [Oceanobacillus halophilus]RKQ29341.1 DNA phosphorothioation-dependent restriction protein DptF [Oceanobacillus halophilus]
MKKDTAWEGLNVKGPSTIVTSENLNHSDNRITEKESKFETTLQVLQSSSKESVVNARSFGELRRYMHVERDIQKELGKILTQLKGSGNPSLILLCGSVGDGKSHLLAYMKDNHADLMQNVFVHNDSTESYDPDKNSLDTLEKVLDPFDDGNHPEQHVVIAINLGVLHNFYSSQRKAGKFQALCDFIDQSGVFKKGQQGTKQDQAFYMLNFADSQPYVLTEEGPKSPFFLKLMDKVTIQDTNNPFYRSWLKDDENGIKTTAHYNYFLLQQKEVKESIVQSLIEVMIKKKVFISTRTFYNFLYEIIVPVQNPLVKDDSSIKVNDMLPNLMYGYPDRSPLLAALNEIDPLKRRLESTDQLVGNFLLKTEPLNYVIEELGERVSIGAWNQVNVMHKQNRQMEYSRLLVRQHALLFRKDYDKPYREFVQFLYSFYHGDEDEIGRLFELIETAVYAWKGSPKDRYVFVDSPNKTFRLAVEINMEPQIDELVFGSAEGKEEVEQFTPSLRMGFSQKGQTFLFELDYKLYALLKQISEGYRPNRQDIQDALQFSEFHDRIVKSADKKTNVLLVHRQDGTMLEVKKPRFSKSKYEVGKVK